MEHNAPLNPQRKRERASEREKFKENKSGWKEEEEKMQITEKAPFVCWIKVDHLKWNIHQNRHSWWGAGNGVGEERGVCDPGAEGVRGRVWLPDENQPGLGNLHTASRWACYVAANPNPDALCQHSDSTEETWLYSTRDKPLHHNHPATTQHAFYCSGDLSINFVYC